MSRRLDSHYLLDLLRQVAEWSETDDGEPVLACQEPDGPVGQYTFTDQEPTSAETFDLRPIFPDELWKKIVDLLVYDSPSATPPQYVYVASSWRNSVQPVVCQALASAGVEHYDFKNPPGGTGFSWREVKTAGEPSVQHWCENCAQPIFHARYRDTPGSRYEPDYDPAADLVTWRHRGGYASCHGDGFVFAKPSTVKPKGSDWESARGELAEQTHEAAEYLQMIEHPRASEGFISDFNAMQRADTFVLVLPCGKSAHLELGWAVGAGKRTAILLEDPVEPELMYKMVDYIAPSLPELLTWLGLRVEVADHG